MIKEIENELYSIFEKQFTDEKISPIDCLKLAFNLGVEKSIENAKYEFWYHKESENSINSIQTVVLDKKSLQNLKLSTE